MKISQPYLLDDEQPIFTKYHQFKRKMTFIRLAYFNDQLKRIYELHPMLKKVTVHGFRHSHASILFAAKSDRKDVQERLGHKIYKLLRIFIHM